MTFTIPQIFYLLPNNIYNSNSAIATVHYGIAVEKFAIRFSEIHGCFPSERHNNWSHQFSEKYLSGLESKGALRQCEAG